MAKSKFRKSRNQRKTKRRRGGDKRTSDGTENAFIRTHANNGNRFTGIISVTHNGQTYLITATPTTDRYGGYDLDGTKDALEIFNGVCNRSESHKVTFMVVEPRQASQVNASFVNPPRKTKEDPWSRK